MDLLRRMGPVLRRAEAEGLHPFREIRGSHHAVASRVTSLSYPLHANGSVLRAGDADHGAAQRRGLHADEVHGFNYFDDRDLIGFVDGTENPVEQAVSRRPSSVRRMQPLPAGAT